MKFTAFYSDTGRVLHSGEASDPQAMATDQISILLNAEHQGGWIDVATGAHNETGPAPGPAFEFNYTTKQWEDPRTLADVKAAKSEAINQARAVANTSTFAYAGKQIAVDALSRGDIDAAHGAILMLQALPPGWPGGWKTMDNDYVPIPDVATWGQFYGAMVAAGTANFNRSQTIKAQLAAATTIAEVEALPSW